MYYFEFNKKFCPILSILPSCVLPQTLSTSILFIFVVLARNSLARFSVVTCLIFHRTYLRLKTHGSYSSGIAE